jgi:quercetin dioxygenase-like cupin family protein
MKGFFLLAASLFFTVANAMECEVVVDNKQVSVLKITLAPHEEVDDHRDDLPRVITAIQGGVLTRIEQDGTVSELVIPSGSSLFLEPDPVGTLHKTANRTASPLEFCVVLLKKEKSWTRQKTPM